MPFDGRVLSGISVLAAVVETGNFVRAAETLGLTQSGVSRAVARLEARVGVRLLDRTPRAVSLTYEGRRFHAHVVPLLAGLEEAAAEAADAAHAVRGRLRVNVDVKIVLGALHDVRSDGKSALVGLQDGSPRNTQHQTVDRFDSKR